MPCFFSISIILRPTPDWERKASGSKCVIFCDSIKILFFARCRFALCRAETRSAMSCWGRSCANRPQTASSAGGCRTMACVPLCACVGQPTTQVYHYVRCYTQGTLKDCSDLNTAGQGDNAIEKQR